MSKAPVHTISSSEVFVGLDKSLTVDSSAIQTINVNTGPSVVILDAAYIAELIDQQGPEKFLEQMSRHDVLAWLKKTS
jgi:hypothetical protein